MHVLFIHQNFPAQFGLVATHLVKKKGFRCTFLSELPPGHLKDAEVRPGNIVAIGSLSRMRCCPVHKTAGRETVYSLQQG
jgi:hypothetical protein